MTSYTIKSKTLNPNKVFILHKSELEKRLDPFFYIPELLELEKKVLAKKPKKLRDYVKAIASGATPKRDEEEKYYANKDNGIPFLRVQNVTAFGLDLSDVKFINKKTHEGYLKRSQITEGDLIVTITGRIASATVAPIGFIGNTNQHSVVIKTINKETSEMLATFLNCSIGQKLAIRLATGGTRPALDYTALLSIPIIEDKRILQIADKVLAQKQQNEAQADKLLSRIDDYLLSELGIQLPNPPENTLKNRMFTSTFKEVSGGRFDPKLYSSQSKKLIESLYKTSFKHQSLKSVIIKSCSGDWGNDDTEGYNKNEFMRCLVIRATEFDNKFNLNVDGSRAKYRLINNIKYKALDIQANDLLIEKSGGSENQPVGRIAILTKELINNYSLGFSNFIHKFRINDSVLNPEFVFNYLKTIHNIKVTDVMQSQTNGIRNLILNEYLNLPIPIPPLDKQKEIAHHITGIRQQAQQLKDKTNQALKKANAEIEQILLNE